MAETPVMRKKRFKNGNESFPILFDDGCLRVYKNPTDEIFVEDVASGATIRINSYGCLRGGLQFTTDDRVDPVRITNTIGWRISPR